MRLFLAANLALAGAASAQTLPPPPLAGTRLDVVARGEAVRVSTLR